MLSGYMTVINAPGNIRPSPKATGSSVYLTPPEAWTRLCGSPGALCGRQKLTGSPRALLRPLNYFSETVQFEVQLPKDFFVLRG